MVTSRTDRLDKGGSLRTNMQGAVFKLTNSTQFIQGLICIVSDDRIPDYQRVCISGMRASVLPIGGIQDLR